MHIAFWHPFGSHADESREEILKRKSKEINENGWTLWSFQYRTPKSIAQWMEEIEILKPSKVLVFCSDSPKAKPPKSETGYLNEHKYPGESLWRPIPDKIEIPHPLGSKEEAIGFKVARVIYPIDSKKYEDNYEWFCIKDSKWRTELIPTRPEYLVRPGGLNNLRKIHAILELDYPYIVHLRRNGTKNEPNISGSLPPEEPFIPDNQKTPEQQPRSEKSQTSPLVHNKSISTNDIGQSQKIKCNLIEDATNTICRQTDPKLDGASVYFTLSGKKKNWRSKKGSKKAIVYYSRSSNHLVVIPKDTVDRYIFDLLFQKKPDDEGYCLSDKYKNFERKDGRIGLRFKIEDDDRLLVQLEAEAEKNVLPKRLIHLQSDYWPKIHPDNIDINSKIIKEIRRICQDFSGGEGIVRIKD